MLDGMEREACVCDHGFERSDLCAEIIIIIIIIMLNKISFSICIRSGGTYYSFMISFNTPGNIIIPTVPYYSLSGPQSKSLTGTK